MATESILKEIFEATASSMILEAVRKNRRFVHYTSAENAMRIIQSKKLWMRKPLGMNDYLELEYGWELLQAAMRKHKKKISNLFPYHRDALSELQDQMAIWWREYADKIYIFCFSEHDDDEDELGRLSMWRAYGGQAGVAIVLNCGFITPSQEDLIKVYPRPVRYLKTVDFESDILKFISNNKDTEGFTCMDNCKLLSIVRTALLRRAICTKHPGFKEEREWRMIYTDADGSSCVDCDLVAIAGVPQSIRKLNLPASGLPSLIDRIIIGPTQHPQLIRQALMDALASAGVADAASRVVMSQIPLRN